MLCSALPFLRLLSNARKFSVQWWEKKKDVRQRRIWEKKAAWLKGADEGRSDLG